MQKSTFCNEWAQRLNIPKYTKVYVICMDICTIKLRPNTKRVLDSFREYRNESYEEILDKIVFVAKTAEKNPKLSQKTVREIEAARERIRNGSFYDEAAVKKTLGL